MENQYPNYEEMENQGASAKPPKKKSTTPPKSTRSELELKVIGLHPEFNYNQIASMLMIPLQQVKAIIEK